jgi:hypothetical protein
MSIRTLIGLAPATVASVTLWASGDLRNTIGEFITGEGDAATALWLHLALDLVVAAACLAWVLHRWARGHDDRQRWILAAFLILVLATTVIAGFREVLFRHSETYDLLALRTMILRRNREAPFRTIIVVGLARQTAVRSSADPVTFRALPGGRLRFILRTALPHVAQHDLNAINDLFSLPESQRLVVLTGTEQRLSSADQLRLDLEAIHPGRSGILDAYATTLNRVRR